MAEFLASARCDKVSDLAGAISKFAEYQRLHEKISDAESSLAKMSDGLSLEEIKLQAAAVDVDELPGLIASLQRQIDEELYPRIKAVSKLIGEESKELQLMDGSGLAAEAAEKMAQVAARIRRLVGQYTRIKLAVMVLKNEIERYREEHQDPILQLASRFFSELTLGSFTGLRTDIDDNDNPILIGVRPLHRSLPRCWRKDSTVKNLGESFGIRKERMSMRHIVLLGALLVLALLVSACGPAAATQAPSEATKAPAKSTTAATEPLAATEPPAATASPAVTATETQSTTGTGAPETGATEAAIPVTGQVEVKAAANFDYGPILVNGDGLPLYIYSQDTQNGGTSACTDEECVAEWPPLTTEGTATAGPGAIQSLLGTITRH